MMRWIFSFLLMALPAQAQISAVPPKGFEVTHRMNFSHKDNQALFGENPLVVLCLSRGDDLPTLLVSKREAFAINGHARALVGAEIFVNGAKIAIVDPYPAKDARSDFIGHMPGPVSRACKEKK